MNKQPYVYYKTPQGRQIHIRTFNTFDILLWWCNRYCSINDGHYYYKGNQILCGWR